MLHRHIPARVRRRATHQRHVNWKAVVEQPLATAQLNELNKVFSGTVIEFSAVIARVNEGFQPNVCDQSRAPPGNLAEQMRDHPLRKVVRFDLPGHRECAQRRAQPPVAADHALNQVLVGQVIDPAPRTIALPSSIHYSEIARASLPQEPRLNRGSQRLGVSSADEPATGHRRTIGNPVHSLLNSNDLAQHAILLGTCSRLLTCTGRR